MCPLGPGKDFYEEAFGGVQQEKEKSWHLKGNLNVLLKHICDLQERDHHRQISMQIASVELYTTMEKATQIQSEAEAKTMMIR